MENNNGFTLKDVIFNLLFIILFVFILLWLFPSKFYLNQYSMDGGIYNSEETQNNQVFNHNITAMKEAAISYFTTSRLPKKIGDKVTMTLRQMRDEKLLLSLIDSKGNVCDEGISYIEMTKEKEEYLLKVHLACSDNEDYILVHLGCYDYCDGDVCEKKDPVEEILYKYQYQLVTPCTLTDWSNWSSWSTNYVSANNNIKVETKVETETINATENKSCPAGYLYNSTNNKCYKSSNTTDIKDSQKITTYKCEKGYTFVVSEKKCKKEITTTASVPAIQNPITYNCDKYEGYTLSGDKCIKKETSTTTDKIDATPVYDYKCEEGNLSSDKKTCNVSTSNYTTFNATCNSYQSCTTTSEFNIETGTWEDKRTCVTKCKYTCPSGYTKDGSKCSGYVNGTKTIDPTKFVASYKCTTDGYALNGTFCTKDIITTSTSTKTASKNPITYYCEDNTHTLVGLLCKYETTNVDVKEPETTINYNCDKYEGYALNGTKCEKVITNTESKDVIITLSCPTGYTLKDNKCTKNITKYRYAQRSCVGGSVDYKWSESNNDAELLNKGYKLTGYKEQINSK